MCVCRDENPSNRPPFEAILKELTVLFDNVNYRSHVEVITSHLCRYTSYGQMIIL